MPLVKRTLVESRFFQVGALALVTNLQVAWICPIPGNIRDVRLYRRVAGLSGSTIINVKRNGAFIFSGPNRPTILATDGNDKLVTVIPDLITNADSGDRFEVDVESIESGIPTGLVVQIAVVS